MRALRLNILPPSRVRSYSEKDLKKKKIETYGMRIYHRTRFNAVQILCFNFLYKTKMLTLLQIRLHIRSSISNAKTKTAILVTRVHTQILIKKKNIYLVIKVEVLGQ